MHIKRKTLPKFWPVSKEGTKYVAVAKHDPYNSIPLIVLVRDVIKIVKNRKELKKILNNKSILVNDKLVKEPNYPLCLFDSLSFPTIKKHYRVILKDKKYSLEEIAEKEVPIRIYKVINKRKLNKNRLQINFNNGKNIISSEKIKVGDFASIDNSKNKILKIIPLERGVKVIVVKGKHLGQIGKIKSVETSGDNTVATISSHSEDIQVNVKNIFALE